MSKHISQPTSISDLAAVRRRFETWLIIIPLIVLALVGGNISMASLPAHIAFSGITIIASVVVLTGVISYKKLDHWYGIIHTPLDINWILLLGMTLISVLINDRRRDIEFWLFPLAIQLPFYYAVITLQRRAWAAISWLRALFVVIGGLCIEALIAATSFYGQIAQLHPPSQDVVPIPFRLYTVLNNPNVFGAVLALTFPAAIGYAFWTSRRWERIATATLMIGMGWALLATGSRGSQLAMIAGSVGTVIGIGIAHRWSQLLRQSRRAQIIMVAAIAVSVLLMSSVLFIESRGSGRSGSEARHVDLWQTALHSAMTHPAFGIGTGGFASAQMVSVSAPPTPIERHAHNLFLNFFAENGVFGSVVFMLWLVMLAKGILRAWHATDMTNRLWISGLIGGIIAFGAAGLVDDPMAQVAPLSVMVIFVALIISVVPLSKSGTYRVKTLTPWFILSIVVLICITASWFTARYATVWNAAQNNPNNSASDWTNTAQILDLVAASDPADGLTQSQAAVAWVEANNGKTNDNLSTIARDKAIADYQQVVQLDPTFSIHHLNLGALLLQRGSIDAAIVELAKAVQMAPNSGITHLNYAVALEQSSRNDLAIAEYKQALMLGIARSPSFWNATATRRSMPTVNSTITLTTDDTLRAQTSGQAALSRGDTAGARYEYTAAIALGGGDAATTALISLGDLDAAQGNQSGALNQYRAAFSRIDRYGELGPGHTGDQSYAVNAFGRFAYISDYVPAVLTLDITPERAARFVTLAQSLASNGDYMAAAHIYRRILVDNPGYQPAEAGLSQLSYNFTS